MYVFLPSLTLPSPYLYLQPYSYLPLSLPLLTLVLRESELPSAFDQMKERMAMRSNEEEPYDDEEEGYEAQAQRFATSDNNYKGGNVEERVYTGPRVISNEKKAPAELPSSSGPTLAPAKVPFPLSLPTCAFLSI